ncbi:MAG: cupin domain-containing protein [Candidatus Hermodarchaeota archaeon]
MIKKRIRTKNKKEVEPIEVLKGIYRRTLIYNKNLMLCNFKLEKNAEVPIHHHKEYQIGYVIKGKIKFETEDGEFIAIEGDSYVFESEEKHGAFILEQAEVIEVFNPAREDYV